MHGYDHMGDQQAEAAVAAAAGHGGNGAPPPQAPPKRPPFVHVHQVSPGHGGMGGHGMGGGIGGLSMGGRGMGGPPPGVHHVPPGMHPGPHGPWGQPGPGVGLSDQVIRDLIVALGQNALNTNNQLVQIAQDLANVIQQNSRGDQGYRHLKPKIEIAKVTAGSAEGLMIELVQFEVDMGELGVSLQSEQPTGSCVLLQQAKLVMCWTWRMCAEAS